MNASQQNAQFIINTAIKLGLHLRDKGDTPLSPELGEDLLKVGANALIDLNRIANALENISTAAAVVIAGGLSTKPGSTIIKPPK